MEFDRAKLINSVSALAERGVFIGTSSWKYPGWLDQIYTRKRYEWDGKFDERTFKDGCLQEYAQVFKTVGVDWSYYSYPSQLLIFRMRQGLPDDFIFAFKVTGDITIKKFTKRSQYGDRAGELNKQFLDAELFKTSFLQGLETFKKVVGLLMFEFSKFFPSDYAGGRNFLEDLDRFLSALPTGWPYGIEMRAVTSQPSSTGGSQPPLRLR